MYLLQQLKGQGMRPKRSKSLAAHIKCQKGAINVIINRCNDGQWCFV